jgi:hypothetical protein
MQARLPSNIENPAPTLKLDGASRRGARRGLPGVFLRARDGRRVPAGWLPDAGERLDNYAPRRTSHGERAMPGGLSSFSANSIRVPSTQPSKLVLPSLT